MKKHTRETRCVLSETLQKIVQKKATPSANLATRAANWKMIMTTSSAWTHHFADLHKVSSCSVSAHCESLGGAVATAISHAAERVETVVCEH